MVTPGWGVGLLPCTLALLPVHKYMPSATICCTQSAGGTFLNVTKQTLDGGESGTVGAAVSAAWDGGGTGGTGGAAAGAGGETGGTTTVGATSSGRARGRAVGAEQYGTRGDSTIG